MNPKIKKKERKLSILAYIKLASSLWDIGKQSNADQTLQNSASDQGTYCFLKECSIKI